MQALLKQIETSFRFCWSNHGFTDLVEARRCYTCLFWFGVKNLNEFNFPQLIVEFAKRRFNGFYWIPRWIPKFSQKAKNKVKNFSYLLFNIFLNTDKKINNNFWSWIVWCFTFRFWTYFEQTKKLLKDQQTFPRLH